MISVAVLVFIGMMFIAIFIFFVWTVSQVDCNDREFHEFTPTYRNLLLGLAALFLVQASIPSEKTMYLMLAGYTAQTVVQSDTADKVLKIVNGKLDGYLEEINKESKEKK